MSRCMSARFVSILATCVFVCLALGCGSVDYASLLPDKLPADLAMVREHTARYAQPTAGAIVATRAGQVVDDLGGLVGCWGTYIENIAEGDGPLTVNHWSALSLTADGRYTMWGLEDFGQLYPMLIVQSGTYAVVSSNRIRLTETLVQSWSPMTHAYDVLDQVSRDSDWLVTRIGNQIKLIMLDAPGDADGTAKQQYATVWQSLQCAE